MKHLRPNHAAFMPDLITHVAINSLTMHDKDALVPAIDDTQQRGTGPQQFLADSHYGSTEFLQKERDLNVEIVAPAQTPKGKLQGKLTLEDFDLDEDGRITRCPAGQQPVETSIAGIRLQVIFAKKVCAKCPNRDRCSASSVGRCSARYQYTHDRVRLRRRRLNERGDGFCDRYRWRAGIEATLSRFKSQMGMSCLRVRGIASVTYVATLRAIGLNIRRVAAYRLAAW